MYLVKLLNFQHLIYGTMGSYSVYPRIWTQICTHTVLIMWWFLWDLKCHS